MYILAPPPLRWAPILLCFSFGAILFAPPLLHFGELLLIQCAVKSMVQPIFSVCALISLVCAEFNELICILSTSSSIPPHISSLHIESPRGPSHGPLRRCTTSKRAMRATWRTRDDVLSLGGRGSFSLSADRSGMLPRPERWGWGGLAPSSPCLCMTI